VTDAAPQAVGAPEAVAPRSPKPSLLVFGSFPPVGTAGSAVTLEVAREHWARREEIEVAAPRDSAARLTVPVAGPLAGRRLAALQRITGTTRLIFCAERELPVPTTGYPAALLPAVQRETARRLAVALRAFDHVTLILCGDHGIPPAALAILTAAATDVVARPEVTGRPGVSALGPSEATAADLSRKAGSMALRRIFGRRAPLVRAGVARGVHAARRLRARV
jgi:hypothetical protein